MKRPGKTLLGIFLFLALVGTATLHAARFAATLLGVSGSAIESWGTAVGLASASVVGALLATVARHGEGGVTGAIFRGTVARVGAQGALLFLAGSATGAAAWSVAGALGHPDDAQRPIAALVSLVTIAAGGALFARGDGVRRRWATDVTAGLSSAAPDVDTGILAEAVRAEDWPRVSQTILQSVAPSSAATPSDADLASRAESTARLYEPCSDGWPPNPGPVPRGEVDRVARLLMTEWERAERKAINVSYIATFVDLARVVSDDQAQARRTLALADLLTALSSRVRQYVRDSNAPSLTEETAVTRLLVRAEALVAAFGDPPRLPTARGGGRADTAEVAAVLRGLADRVRRG